MSPEVLNSLSEAELDAHIHKCFHPAWLKLDSYVVCTSLEFPPVKWIRLVFSGSDYCSISLHVILLEISAVGSCCTIFCDESHHVAQSGTRVCSGSPKSF